MKVKDILKKLTDNGLYIEFKDKTTGSSYGFYKKSELVYNDKFNNYGVKALNVQYIDDKRLLVITIDY